MLRSVRLSGSARAAPRRAAIAAAPSGRALCAPVRAAAGPVDGAASCSTSGNGADEHAAPSGRRRQLLLAGAALLAASARPSSADAVAAVPGALPAGA